MTAPEHDEGEHGLALDPLDRLERWNDCVATLGGMGAELVEQTLAILQLLLGRPAQQLTLQPPDRGHDRIRPEVRDRGLDGPLDPDDQGERRHHLRDVRVEQRRRPR